MSRKTLILLSVSLLVIINGSIFGTLYVVDLMAPPTQEELDALRKAEEQVRIPLKMITAAN